MKLLDLYLIIINAAFVAGSKECYVCSNCKDGKTEMPCQINSDTTEDNFWCFKRTWALRDRLVKVEQKGCYRLPYKASTLPEIRPQCHKIRRAVAETTLCLCDGDLCNLSSHNQPAIFSTLLPYIIACIAIV